MCWEPGALAVQEEVQTVDVIWGHLGAPCSRRWAGAGEAVLCTSLLSADKRVLPVTRSAAAAAADLSCSPQRESLVWVLF